MKIRANILFLPPFSVEINIYFVSFGPFSKLQWNNFPAWCFNTRHVSGFYVCVAAQETFQIENFNSPLPFCLT